MSAAEAKVAGAGLVARLDRFVAEFDERFGALLTPDADVPAELLAAIRYSALAPGKRLRPYLVSRCCTLAGGDVADAWVVGAAVECIHAFSLIHDDLPAMDDDDMRRGLPACHKRFSEATAILAGDALVALAFELLAKRCAEAGNAAGAAPGIRGADDTCRMVRVLAEAAGWTGMIGGQSADMLGERQPPNEARTEYIHTRKTARLFEASCRLGAITGGGSADVVGACAGYGALIGLAFQIADDLSDARPEGTASDPIEGCVDRRADASKQTYARCVGIEESRRIARTYAKRAVAMLDRFGRGADDLRALAWYIIDRDF